MLVIKITSERQLPSDTKFGWFFTVIFLVAAIYCYTAISHMWGVVLLYLSIVTGIITLVFPNLLLPFNRLWFGLGVLLGKIVSPIVLGVIFFLLITPVSLFTRILGRDALSLKKRQISSYWVDRDPVGPEPESFKNQF